MNATGSKFHMFGNERHEFLYYSYGDPMPLWIGRAIREECRDNG